MTDETAVERIRQCAEMAWHAAFDAMDPDVAETRDYTVACDVGWAVAARAVLDALRTDPELAAEALGPQPAFSEVEGRVVIDWPKGATFAVVPRDVLDGYAENVTAIRAKVEDAERMLASTWALVESIADERPDAPCLDCGSDQCDGYPTCRIPEEAL